MELYETLRRLGPSMARTLNCDISRLLYALCLGALASAIWVHAALAQSTLAPLQVAESFIESTFPELASQQLRFVVNAGGALRSPWRFMEIGVQINPNAYQEIRTAEDLEKPLLQVDFEFSVSGELVSARARGRYVKYAESRRFEEVASQGKAWSRDRITTELRKRGAMFDPDQGDAVAKRLPGGTWSELLGPLTIDSVEFLVPASSDDTIRRGMYAWNIVLKSLNSATRYLVLVEPFDGQVVYLARQDSL
jgi:hypothetical protein